MFVLPRSSYRLLEAQDLARAAAKSKDRVLAQKAIDDLTSLGQMRAARELAREVRSWT